MFNITPAHRASVSKSVCVRALFTAAFAFFIFIVSAQSASAATFTVTTTADSGTGSLRAAIASANAASDADTIVFAAPLFDTAQAIDLTSAELLISQSITITGRGAQLLTVRRSTAGGTPNFRIFNVTAGTVGISGMTISNGAQTGGGGVLNSAPALTLSGVAVSGNTAIFNGGSTDGGGIYNFGGGTTTILNSTVSGNTATNFGGGIRVVNGTVNITNSTVSGNTANNIATGGGIHNTGTLNMNNATVTLNNVTASNASNAGGVYNGGTVNTSNTIISGNTAAGSTSPDVGGTFASQGYNLIGNTTGSVGFGATGDILNQPAQLAPLAYNGGTTRTHALCTAANVPNAVCTGASPAIDQGSLVAGVSVDGRGVIRPFDIFGTANATGGNGADIGAFELIPTFARGWGYNSNGEIGDGTFATQSSPVDLLGGFADIVSFDGGYYHGLGLRSNGTIVSWGLNDSGQLGRTAAANSVLAATPTLVPGLSNVAAVAGGELHSFAILADGTVRAWGNDGSGQLGDGSATTAGGITPVTVATNAAGTTSLTGIIRIAGGTNHSIALKSDGTVWTWGDDFFGQLGDGAGDSSRDFAQQVPGLANVIAVDAGDSHNLALLADGSVRTWGYNANGQLGDNSTIRRFAPVTPTNLGAGAAITQIAAGYRHSVALKTDGTLLTWGDDSLGQLGDGTAGGGTPLVPTAINTIGNVTDIKSTLGFVTYARKRDGSIFAWGYNNYGEIGNGTTNTTGCVCQPTPTQSNVGAGISVFGANGLGGYAAMPSASVATGAQFVRLGDATVNFPNVTTGGTAQIRTFDPSTTGLTFPMNYTPLANSNGYDITSTAAFTGNAQVCLKVANVISSMDFFSLYIMHDDNGDGTLDAGSNTRNYQKREICRPTTSFSPFVLAVGPFAPTAATVSISGRVITPENLGLTNALVTLTDSQGISRTIMTGKKGNFRFNDVAAGETYILSVSARRYTFAAQVITVSEDLTDIVFTPNE